MAFTGIPIAALDFYEDLEADNSKAFWTAHKPVYDEAVRAPLEALGAALAEEFGAPKVFRPYRDVRFAKDKTPYKTNQGVYFADSSRYLHITAAGLFVAGGYWDTSSPQVARLREAVADDVSGPRLEQAIAAVTKAGFEIGGDRLSRVPTGYDKEHPRGELLKHKSLTGHAELGAPAWLSTKRAVTEVTKRFRALAPLVDWLDDNVGR
ncbi:MAG TPA: DUF2461 domain-containing protein [Mycobacteriales bacterium]|nr:DUF2461 domain-containing protein [Mycobacteriales bacterium]